MKISLPVKGKKIKIFCLIITLEKKNSHESFLLQAFKKKDLIYMQKLFLNTKFKI